MDQNDGPSALENLFQTQRKAHMEAPFPDWTVRRDRLLRLRALLTENEAAIEAAIDADFAGRPPIETQIADLYPSLAEIRAALHGGRRWMKPRGAWVSKWFLPARAHIMPRPLGVVGIIVTWNYPVYMAMGPLAGALAAGNRAMLKLSESTPAYGLLMQRLVAERFRPDELTVILGGPEIGAAFAALPFGHILFTGSAVVGRKVMSAASMNLTPVTLELGGKSPAVLAPGYPVAKAVERIMAGKLLNAGQTCLAPDYVLVPGDSVEEFVRLARAQAQRMYPAGLADKDYCSIIDRRQYERLAGLLSEARSTGARVEELFTGPARDDAAHRMAPVAVVRPALSSALMRDEIFGPILPVLAYSSPEEAVGFINAQPHPLALYWFDHDKARSRWALEQTHVGGACVNETLVHIAQEELPFGGIGPSGMGHYHGKWGFDTMSKLTPVFRQSPLNGLGLFMPPYRPIVRRLLALMKRF